LVCYRAAWILPISQPPIRDGWVLVDRGRIVDLGAGDSPAAASLDRLTETVQDLGDVVLMPGLVNAHTHLELSYLRQAIAPSTDFVVWIRAMMEARRRHPDGRDPVIVHGIDDGIDEAVRSGTALVGDISNTLVPFAVLTRSPLAALVFYELLGFRIADPVAAVNQAVAQIGGLAETELVRSSLAAHAPYSVAPLLFRAIRDAADRSTLRPYSVHLSESQEEVEFIAQGTGAWRRLLEELGVWQPAWVPPGGSPVAYLDDGGFLSNRAIVVHGVQMSASDLERLARRGATLVTCPRSNAYTGAGTPPIERFYTSGVRVAVGTDSLASTPDLNLFSELAAIRRLAPALAASAILDSATRRGAVALGFGADYGTIEPGRRDRLLSVSGPAFSSATDVEEYLVSGIQPAQLRWV
jgi:cytosine/adenosine deaminase-related metal-dependent hydrolase